MNELVKSVSCFLYGLLPIRKKCVLFSSFYGQYNDNPKYVSLRLHEVAPDVELVWVKSQKAREEFPSYVKTVEFGSKEYYKYIYRAQVIVENHMGMRSKTAVKTNALAKLLARRFSKKRKGQMNVSTWHGSVSMKKIALDEPNRKGKECFFTNTDFAIGGCQQSVDVFHSAFFEKLPVKMYGTPRNDILFKQDVNVSALKEKLGLPKDKKILLYAPTFRNSVVDSGVSQMESIDYQALFQKLQEKFGGEWCFVFRVHNNVLLKIDTEAIVSKCAGQLYAGNVGDDMAEYIVCSDVLISDYSGCIFDYALTKKPCFLYAPDLEHYEKDERGFYLNIRDLPFSIAQTVGDLLDDIQTFDEGEYQARVSAFLRKIGDVERGNAAEKIVDDILAFINR